MKWKNSSRMFEKKKVDYSVCVCVWIADWYDDDDEHPNPKWIVHHQMCVSVYMCVKE